MPTRRADLANNVQDYQLNGVLAEVYDLLPKQQVYSLLPTVFGIGGC